MVYVSLMIKKIEIITQDMQNALKIYNRERMTKMVNIIHVGNADDPEARIASK